MTAYARHHSTIVLAQVNPATGIPPSTHNRRILSGQTFASSSRDRHCSRRRIPIAIDVDKNFFTRNPKSFANRSMMRKFA